MDRDVPKKKIKKNEEQKETNLVDANFNKRILIRFKNPEGNEIGSQLDLPLNTTVKELEEIINKLLENDEQMIYSFFFEATEIKTSLEDFVKKIKNFTSEKIFPITYHPQSLYFVKPITRSTSSLPGHTEAVLSVSFSPNSKHLASGSGDSTVRFWDINTETPHFTCEGHKNWVLCISWSPDGQILASGSMDNEIRLWDPFEGTQIGKNLRGHNKWITSLSWEPLHQNEKCERLVSSSKDGTLKIWSVLNQTCLMTFSSHKACITKVIWGGQNLIYSSSEDRTVKVWSPDGLFIRELSGHGHWVNTLALNTDYVLRTGAFDEEKKEFKSKENMKEYALKRYEKIKGSENERLVSGSDDFTLFMWEPKTSSKPKTRMTGHQQPVNHISYSPDGRFLVSASFDKNLKLWDGYNGLFLATLKGHVGPVYQVSWSFDSRMLVSGSKDSTLKVWDMKTRKLMFDLPGHSDEIYAIDWSPDGEKVCSGGKDRLLKLWRN